MKAILNVEVQHIHKIEAIFNEKKKLAARVGRSISELQNRIQVYYNTSA